MNTTLHSKKAWYHGIPVYWYEEERILVGRNLFFAILISFFILWDRWTKDYFEIEMEEED